MECLRTYQEPRRSFKCMPYAESNMHPPCTLPASHYKKRCPSLFVLYNPVCTICSSWFNLSPLLYIISTGQLRALRSRKFTMLYPSIAILTFIIPHRMYNTKRYPVSRKIINAIRSSSTIYHCQRPSQLSTLSRISPFTLIIAPYSQHPLGFLRPSSSTSPEFRINFLQDFSLRLHNSNVGVCAY